MKWLKREPNTFNGKRQVDLVWRALLTRADYSVDVFAGDVSWAESNKESLSDRTQAGVVIRSLCRWPSAERLLGQVRILIDAGVQVKFYTDDLVKIRGLVIDATSGPYSGTALTVSKIPRDSIGVDPGQAGDDSLFDYEARRYLPSHDGAYIATLRQLFDSIWDGLPQGIILDEHVLSRSRYCRLLSRSHHYRDLRAENVEVERVSIPALYSCCRTVKTLRLERIGSLLDAYQRFSLEPFETCRIEGPEGHSLLLPPIVERQPDGKLVVIDGMHRIYYLATHTDAQQVTCLVLENIGALPSTPVPFRDLRVAPTKLPRVSNFPNYDHERFRDIKTIERHLAVVANSP